MKPDLFLFALILTLALPAPGSPAVPSPTGICGPDVTTNCVQKVEVKSLAGPCVPDEFTLCLQHGRFRVSSQFGLQHSPDQHAHAVPIVNPDGTVNDGGGNFWFFGKDNPEVLVKVLNACIPSLGNHYWVFFAATTNVLFQVEAGDSLADIGISYYNPQNHVAVPVQDTDAFATCP